MKPLLTPIMGWNPWNYFGTDNVDEKIIHETAEAMIDFGFLKAGYNYINIDDCWMKRERDKAGCLVPDPNRFPDGMKAVGDYLHKLGFSFGLYAGAGVLTFGGSAGSFGHEREDAKLFADWGVDLLKYDFGFVAPGNDPSHLFRRMGQALSESGRDIILSGCIADDTVADWMRFSGASMWRIANDLIDEWHSIINMAKRGIELSNRSGVNGFNDLDMLVVGNNGQGHHGHHGSGCTFDEYQTHFALWCMLASPLILGHDVRSTTPDAAKILLNEELIAIDQDVLGVSAYKLPTLSNNDLIIARPLSNGDIAICAVNDTDRDKTMILSWDYCGFDLHDKVLVRDVINHADLGEFSCGAPVAVKPHACCVWRIKRV